ncbi:MAG: hypothetical protein V3W14_12575, partial [Candidatus Neomarinimicrobiota bacterium]
LYLDCLIPLPIDEGFLNFSTTQGGTTYTNYIGWSPEGGIQGRTANSTPQNAAWIKIQSENNFNLPPGDGRIYCVSEFTGADNITYTTILNNGDSGRYYERWLSLRGSE